MTPDDPARLQTDAAVFRTQSSLDEGVAKMNKIYQKYNDVGIKDRSMIWNSCVLSRPLPLRVADLS